MQPFTFFKHDGSGAVPVLDLEPFTTAEEALAHGRRLLALDRRYREVVIFQGEREVAKLAAETH